MGVSDAVFLAPCACATENKENGKSVSREARTARRKLVRVIDAQVCGKYGRARDGGQRKRRAKPCWGPFRETDGGRCACTISSANADATFYGSRVDCLAGADGGG